MFVKFEFRSLFVRLKNFLEIVRQRLKRLETSALGAVDSIKLQEASIALWLINSDIPNPKLEDILMFSGKDSFNAAYEYVFQQLKENKLNNVYEEIEKPIMHIIKEMQNFGILIDKKYFENLSREYHKELDKLTKKIYEMAGTEFNINSPKQMGEILFGKMGMKSNKKANATGTFSTKVSVLEELEEENPIIREILAYRELQKLLSTYIDVIPKMSSTDDRLHAKFLQNGSTTGRFSSQDPNLQNLPIKTELGKESEMDL